MIKKRALILILLAYVLILFFMYLGFYFRFIAPLGWGGLVFLTFFTLYVFSYRKILITHDSFVFEAIGKARELPFEVFKNAWLDIERTAMISVPGRRYSVLINHNTKDGLIKIVLLSEKIIHKTELINRIERLGNMC
jgi:hypothetical protein